METDSERVKQVIALMDAIVCPPGLSPKRFADAKRIKARIWRGEVSASMSGIEYSEPEATWIADEIDRLLAAIDDEVARLLAASSGH